MDERTEMVPGGWPSEVELSCDMHIAALITP
jgi:hypothetical protein